MDVKGVQRGGGGGGGGVVGGGGGGGGGVMEVCRNTCKPFHKKLIIQNI